MKFFEEILKIKNRMPGFIAAKRALFKGEQLGVLTARANKSGHADLIKRLEKSLNTKINPENVHFVSDSGYDGGDAAEKKLNVIKKYSKLYEKVKFYDDEEKNISIVKNSGLPNVKVYNIKEFDPKKLNVLKASNANVIHLFDLDGTVWKLPAFVRIMKNGKEIAKISQEQFATGYKLKTGESFDFSDFTDSKKLKAAAKKKGIFNEYFSVIQEGGKLFGSRSRRISATEMNSIFTEIEKRVRTKFEKFELTKSLKTKTDHGDIDIIVYKPKEEIKTIIDSLKPEEYHKNGNVYSFLYNGVHVDFISFTDKEKYESAKDYYSYGDLNGTIGYFARQLGFQYGLNGIKKFYKDSKGNYSYFTIAGSLRDALHVLGYDPKKFDEIDSEEDIIEFISSSPLFDSSFFKKEDLSVREKRNLRVSRESGQRIKKELAAKNKKAKIKDEDFFFKKYFKNKYEELEKEKNAEVIKKSDPYNGEWIQKTFSVSPGPIIGKIKKIISDNRDLSKEELIKKINAEIKK